MMSNVGRSGDGDMELEASGGNAGGGEKSTIWTAESNLRSPSLCSGSALSWFLTKGDRFHYDV